MTHTRSGHYIIETATSSQRRTLGDAATLLEAQTQCSIAMSVAPPEGPTFAFALDEDGRWVVALERTDDGRILDHLKAR